VPIKGCMWGLIGVVGMLAIIGITIVAGQIIGLVPFPPIVQSPSPAQATLGPAPVVPSPAQAIPIPAITNTVTTAKPTLVCPPSAPGKVEVRWYIGIGPGTDPAQVKIEQSVVDDFNASQDNILLTMEVVPPPSAASTLTSEIVAGRGPDIVGVVGWAASNIANLQSLDLTPLIECSNFDTAQLDAGLVKIYRLEDQGIVGLPFAIYPSAMEYNTALFDKAGLKYPPARYGDKYIMPDGSQLDWTWDTVARISQLLTVDTNGKNATQPGFNLAKIRQYGFSWGFENQPEYWGAYWQGGSELAPGGSRGMYKAQIPQPWKDSWAWMYNGIWGKQPFIPNRTVEQSATFGSGNTFSSGKIAMTVAPVWYTCCMGNIKTWDFAAVPSYNGRPGGRMDADTFRILKTSKHPREAFTVLTYLVTTGVQKLIVGSAGNPPMVSAIPAIPAHRQAYLASVQARFPWVKNWDTLMAGIQYPDLPNAESWAPNYNDAWVRNTIFGNRLVTSPGLNLVNEEAILESDLTTIYNK
jgi:multiple sugar transport system substrate-binding protein